MENKLHGSLFALVCATVSLIPATGFAGTWSGVLVDGPCFRSAEQNHNVSDSPAVRDINLEIQLCRPKARTRSFALVLPDDTELAFAPDGNARAAELVRGSVVRLPIYVVVNGELIRKNTIAITSITASH